MSLSIETVEIPASPSAEDHPASRDRRPARGHARPAEGLLRWSPTSAFNLYFPEDEPCTDLDVLVIDRIPGNAARLATDMPDSRVTELRWPGHRAMKQVDEHPENLVRVDIPVEAISNLDLTFDLVLCDGVLHHLADPVAGLRALGEVTRPWGAIAVSVDARHGRGSVALLRDLFQRIGLDDEQPRGHEARRVLQTIPEDHPSLAPRAGSWRQSVSGDVLDTITNPLATSFDVHGIRELVEASELRFHRWLTQGHYSPELSPLAVADVRRFLESSNRWDQAGAMELYYGTIQRHAFIVTHDWRDTPETLFGGERILDAVPRKSAYLEVAHGPGTVTLSSSVHEVPVRLESTAEQLVPVLKAIDGKRTVGEVIEQVHAHDLDDRARGISGDVWTFRCLYRGDFIELCKRPRS